MLKTAICDSFRAPNVETRHEFKLRETFERIVGHLPVGVESGDLHLLHDIEDHVPILPGHRRAQLNRVFFPVDLVKRRRRAHTKWGRTWVTRRLRYTLGQLRPAIEAELPRDNQLRVSRCDVSDEARRTAQRDQ